MGSFKLVLLLNTLLHIKPTQLFYQLYYRIISKRIKPSPVNFSAYGVNFSVRLPSNYLYKNNCFHFLNKSKTFSQIDWNFSDYGKLWTYNLNYFDFLQQENISKEQGLELIQDFCSNSTSIKDGYEPYPISLRAINWVKFLSKNSVNDEVINQQLYADLYRLNGRLEFHILANHLFENGFGLLFGAYFFKDEKLYKNAVKIIRSELKEQILPDGAHYELTPMYHQIILHRILDCYQLVSQNNWKKNELALELKEAASRMLGWLNNMTFASGELPLVNDSSIHIAPSSDELIGYAKELGITALSLTLNESGYRFFRTKELEVLFDAGQIAPSYQPGHSHADNLQILVNKNRLPVLVDTGISTYEKNQRRQLERSTISHNTVSLDRKNSSEVWSGFRVGRRASTTIVKENEMFISAKHNGYRNLGINHERTLWFSDQGVRIQDQLHGFRNGLRAEGHLHFHPDRKVQIQKNKIFVDEVLFIKFQSDIQITTEDYSFCNGFNKLLPATKVIYQLTNQASFLLLN
jgi:hypothetical protein